MQLKSKLLRSWKYSIGVTVCLLAGVVVLLHMMYSVGAMKIRNFGQEDEMDSLFFAEKEGTIEGHSTAKLMLVEYPS